MMIFITSVFIALGMLSVLWFGFGFLWFLFGTKIIIPPAPWHPPLMTKLSFVVSASFAMPWLLFTKGTVPIMAAMFPENFQSPEDEAAFIQWRQSVCPCETCRRERGEP